MDQEQLEEIKAREQAARTGIAGAIQTSQLDVKALIAEVERLTEENHKQFETIGQQGREMNRRDEIIKQQDQQIATLTAELERLQKCRDGCKIDCLLDEYNKVVAERVTLKSINSALESDKINSEMNLENLEAEVQGLNVENATLKKALKDRLEDLEAISGIDSQESYTSGYKNGHRNGQIELIRWILKMPSDALQQAQEQEDKK